MKIILQKPDYALVPLLKIKGTKSIGKSPHFLRQAPLNQSSSPLLSSKIQCTTQ